MTNKEGTMRPTPNAQRPTPNAQRPTPYHALNSDDAIHIALCLHDPSGTYAQHAGVVITSIFENTSSKIIIHIFHDETLTEPNRKNFIRTAEKYHQTIDFVDVRQQITVMPGKTIDVAEKIYTLGALYRLLIPDILTDNSKIIYLDCDIIVNLDIKNLWDIDISNYCLGGVHSKDSETLDEAVRAWLNGYSIKTYINSGVLLMNLDKIRERGSLFADSMVWLEHHRYLFRFPDQDVLNGLFYKSVLLIDNKYNNFNPKTEEQCANSIIHTPARDPLAKTWGAAGLVFQVLYWRYFLYSAWGESKSQYDLIEIMLDASKSDSHFLTPYQRTIFFIRDAVRKIFWTNRLSASIRYIILEIIYRIKQHLAY